MSDGNAADLPRRAIVVIGPHRSGTSLLARVLEGLGVDLGTNLVGPNPGNPEGHWEHRGIVDAQEQLLKDLRRQWFWQGGSVPLPEGWRDRKETHATFEQLCQMVTDGCRPGGPPWGFKDPRTVRLLPLWQEIFDRVQVRAEYVFALRHPRAVAASLDRRDRLPLFAGALLWCSAVGDAWQHARQATVIDYDAWFDDRARSQMERLAALVAAAPESIDAAMASVKGGLRHESAAEEAPIDPPLAMAEALYDDLEGATTLDGGRPEFGRRIEAYLEHADVFQYWVLRYERRLRTLERELRVARRS